MIYLQEEIEETKRQWQKSISEWRKNHDEDRRKIVAEFEDSIMTCSREDASIEKVKHAKNSLNRKQKLVNHASDELANHTDPNNSRRTCNSRSKAKKVSHNGNDSVVGQRRSLRDRKTSACISNDEFMNHTAKGQASRPMLASPSHSSHRTSSRLSSKADSSRVNSHSVRSSRQSSRSQNVDQNCSVSHDQHFTRRSPRKPSLGQAQCR